MNITNSGHSLEHLLGCAERHESPLSPGQPIEVCYVPPGEFVMIWTEAIVGGNPKAFHLVVEYAGVEPRFRHASSKRLRRTLDHVTIELRGGEYTLEPVTVILESKSYDRRWWKERLIVCDNENRDRFPVFVEETELSRELGEGKEPPMVTEIEKELVCSY